MSVDAARQPYQHSQIELVEPDPHEHSGAELVEEE